MIIGWVGHWLTGCWDIKVMLWNVKVEQNFNWQKSVNANCTEKAVAYFTDLYHSLPEEWQKYERKY